MPCSYALDEVDLPDAPGNLFDVLVGTGLLCRQCFRRLRRRVPHPDDATAYDHRDVLAFVDEELPDERRYNTIPREADISGRRYWVADPIPDRLEGAAPPDGPSAEGSTTACDHCGTVDYSERPPTRSTTDALEAARGLSATLTEFAVAHDPVLLMTAVEAGKRDSDTSGDDVVVFQEAVTLAVAAGRDA